MFIVELKIVFKLVRILPLLKMMVVKLLSGVTNCGYTCSDKIQTENGKIIGNTEQKLFLNLSEFKLSLLKLMAIQIVIQSDSD